jgi:beta-lactamase superfamily II metal-dependent hydrolase
MATLRVRAYNVLFGDALLVSFPDVGPTGTATDRHILIDVGNVLFEGGSDEVFQPVVEDILHELAGAPLDLYIMTHEHMDHIQGLPYAEEKLYTTSDQELQQRLKPTYTWLTASSAADYYDHHPDAKQKRLLFDAAYQAIHRYLNAVTKAREEIPAPVHALWANNNPRKTSDCVKYLRALSDDLHTSYVHRDFDPQGHHPFHEAQIEIWAPEEDTSTYYGRFSPLTMWLGVTPAPPGSRKRPTLTDVRPPAGVYAGAFYNLVNMRKNHLENLLAIDRAANNTSVVFCLTWRGVRLLFTGDAEERSWRVMDAQGVLKPVHFLKVSHHGSFNGTPEPAILNKILPTDYHEETPRKALVSTMENIYNNVPDPETLTRLAERCTIYDVYKQSSVGEYVDITFEAPD